MPVASVGKSNSGPVSCVHMYTTSHCQLLCEEESDPHATGAVEILCNDNSSKEYRTNVGEVLDTDGTEADCLKTWKDTVSADSNQLVNLA